MFKQRPIVPTLLVLILGVLIQSSLSKPLRQQIELPTYYKIFVPLTTQVPSNNKSLTIGFPDIVFEISSKVYSKQGKTGEDNMYEAESYSEDRNCEIYPTTMKTQTKATIEYPDDVQNIKYTVLYSQETIEYFMLGSDSNIYIYNIQEDNLYFRTKINVDPSVSQVKDSQLISNVELIAFYSRLFLATKDSLYVSHIFNKDAPTFIKMSGYESMDKLVDVGFVEVQTRIQGTTIWVSSERQIILYRLMETESGVSLQKEKSLPITAEVIEAITYCRLTQKFYVVTGHKLLTLDKNTQSWGEAFQLQGICKSINKINSTLYLGCRYDRINYVMEVRLEANDMVLNRYYDESVVEGIRDVQYLGFDRIGIIGDQQSLIVGESVNRNTLLDLSARRTKQNYDYVYSFGLIDIFYLPQFSSLENSCILSVGESSISYHTLAFESPELQCEFGDDDHSDVMSMLVKFNTSHCPGSESSSEQRKSGTFTQCEIFFPLNIEFRKKEYEKKTANLIFFVAMVLLLVGLLLCLGFAVQIRNRANLLIQETKKKIDKLKKSRNMQEMKKI